TGHPWLPRRCAPLPTRGPGTTGSFRRMASNRRTSRSRSWARSRPSSGSATTSHGAVRSTTRCSTTRSSSARTGLGRFAVVPRQALLFDLDDTLIADSSDTLAALAETCALVEPDAERCRDLAVAVKARAWELWASPAYGGAIGHELGISGTEAMFSDFRVGHDTVRRLTESHLSFEREVWEQCLTAHGARCGPEQVDELRRSFR